MKGLTTPKRLTPVPFDRARKYASNMSLSTSFWVYLLLRLGLAGRETSREYRDHNIIAFGIRHQSITTPHSS
jgi:hypothetical protein